MLGVTPANSSWLLCGLLVQLGLHLGCCGPHRWGPSELADTLMVAPLALQAVVRVELLHDIAAQRWRAGGCNRNHAGRAPLVVMKASQAGVPPRVASWAARAADPLLRLSLATVRVELVELQLTKGSPLRAAFGTHVLTILL